MRQLDFAGGEHTIGELPRGVQLSAFDRAAFSARVPGTLPLDTDQPVSGAHAAGGDATRPDPGMFGRSITTGDQPLTPYARSWLAYHAKVAATDPQLFGFKSGDTGRPHGPTR